MNIPLVSPEATEALGTITAKALLAHPRCRSLFLRGGLGAGKTTLIRALVAALPGGESAESASPSFNLCNIYPTTPPVAHFDLYRQEPGSIDESLLDFLEDERHVVLIEWAERLPLRSLPPERLECELRLDGAGRTAVFAAFGRENGQALLDIYAGLEASA